MKKAHPEQLSARELTRSLLDRLGRAIASGRYDNEPFPTEARLSHQYEVSLAIVREVLRLLGAKGLLRKSPHRVIEIQSRAAWNWFDKDVLQWRCEPVVAPDFMRQITDLRLAIEPAAAALAARAATKAQISVIACNFARMKLAAIPSDALDAEIRFHTSILEASANLFFAQFRAVVTTAIYPCPCMAVRLANRRENLNQHGTVMRAIDARRPEQARKAMSSLILDGARGRFRSTAQ